MKIVHKNDTKMFALFRDYDGSHYLDVVCGGIGLFEVRVKLTEEEIVRFH